MSTVAVVLGIECLRHIFKYPDTPAKLEGKTSSRMNELNIIEGSAFYKPPTVAGKMEVVTYTIEPPVHLKKVEYRR